MTGQMDMGAAADAANQGLQDGSTAADTGVMMGADTGVMMGADMGMQVPADMGIQVEPDDCVRLCEYLEMCGSCFQDEQGECLDNDGCAAVCRTETAPTVATCVAALPACDEAGFQGCFDANAGDDDCAQTCRFLEDCEQCFLDEFEECLSIAACAAVCRENTPPEAAACIATLDDCGGIDACYQ
jgi:hypothetical protein